MRDLKFLRANTDRQIKATVPGPFTMGKQAQDDYYKDEEAVAMDYAAAVNAEIKDLFAAGADVVQIDEPWMQQHPDKARQYGLKALDRALDGVTGTIAVHLCFGYAAVVHDKPSGYSFLPELEGSQGAAGLDRGGAAQARPHGLASNCRRRPSFWACIDLSDMTIETPQIVAGAHPRGAGPCAGGADGGGAGLRYEIPAARGRLRQDEGDGRRRGDRAARNCAESEQDAPIEERRHALCDRTESDRCRRRALEATFPIRACGR